MHDLSALGSRSAGLWTRADVLATRSVGRYDALARSRAWQAPWPGVWTDAGVVLDPVQRAMAAVLASGGGADDAAAGVLACGRTAARVWGLPLVDDDDPATGAVDHRHDDVRVPRHARAVLEHEGGVLHRRQLRLDPGDVVRHVSGLLLTSPVRTVADCAGLLTGDALLCVTDAALHRGMVTAAQLDDLVARRRGTRSVTALRSAVHRADGRAEAPSESLLRALALPRFPGLVPQVTLLDHAARPVARFDLGDPRARVAVEADGRLGHAGPDMVARDRRRDRASRRAGWLVERFTWFDLRRRRSEVVDRIAELYAEQARRGA